MGRNASLVIHIIIMEIDGSIIMQNCGDRMNYLRGFIFWYF